MFVEKSLPEVHYNPGHHILLDFWGGQKPCDIDFIENVLHQAALACKATVLEIKLHSFGENAGVTGVAILAESHISIHTWPEIDFMALDVFMCGSCDARLAIDPLLLAFKPKKTEIRELIRGKNSE